MTNLKFVLIAIVMAFALQLQAQEVTMSREELILLTPQWKGERFPDGRPKVPDNILERMKHVSVEEAWATMKNNGYAFQIAEGWKQINPDSVLVGRAFTTIFMAERPDVWKAIDSVGKKKGWTSKNFSPIQMLCKDDIYVVNLFEAKL